MTFKEAKEKAKANGCSTVKQMKECIGGLFLCGQISYPEYIEFWEDYISVGIRYSILFPSANYDSAKI